MRVFFQSVMIVLFFTNVLAACKEQSPHTSQSDISHILAKNGVDVQTSSVLIVRLSDSKKWSSNESRHAERFPPASTSKIPHTLIALEEQFAHPGTGFEWDGVKRFASTWNQDQTLTTAFRRSAVWVYQNITAGLGHATMADWIKTFEYGNMDIGPPEDITTYWLNGPLEVSIDDQIRFLSKLAKNELPLSGKTYKKARTIMAVKRGHDGTLYAKTGWRHDGINTDIGWYVGWVEIQQRGVAENYVFAFNMDMVSPKDRHKRVESVSLALKYIGALPASAP